MTTTPSKTTEQSHPPNPLLSLAARMAHLGGWRLDVARDEVTLDQEACGIFDLPPGTRLNSGQGYSYFPARDRSRLSEAMRLCITRQKPCNLEVPLVTTRGRRRWVRIIGQPVVDGRGWVSHLEGAIQDVTERKQTVPFPAQADRGFEDYEERLGQLAERSINILESITDAFFTLDRGWRFTYVNHEAERLLRRGRHEMLGRSIWELFPSGLGTDFAHHYRRARVTGRTQSFEAWFEPLALWLSVRAYPSPEGLSVYFQDVTERRRAEAERERIRELEAERTLADKANATKSQFLASMSHEIRTPINGIVGMVDVLHQTSLRGHQLEMVDIIRESAQSLLGIVEDILDFSKIEAGKLELAPAPFSPAALVRSIGLLLDRMALNHRVELTLYTDPRLPEQVYGDELRLSQILLNLVNNAIKFSSRLERPGRVSLRLILSRMANQTATMEFRVRDNGIGMTAETLSRLFSPFSQADASTTRQYGGTGLGLSITHNLVSLMGGDIKVTSEHRVGTEFRVTLNLPVVAEPTDKPPLRLPDLSGARCLIWPDGLGEDLAGYLRAGGAGVWFPGDALPETQGAGESWLLVRDLGRGGQPTAVEAEQHRKELPGPDVRWLLIGRGYRRRVRRERDGVYSIDANSMSQLAFVRAAAVALGRETLEAAGSVPNRRASPTGPPERNRALAEGRLVLVVEDNETNQRVIRHQLGLLGFAADICANGQTALEHWEQVGRGYVLILSDLHMPELDGYDLVRAVRTREAERDEPDPVPFVALTANALRGETERCYALGMDDYLTKPVPLSALQSVLERWIPPSAASPGTDTQDLAEEPVSDSDTLDIEVLRELIGGDQALLMEFVESFRSSSSALVEQIRAAAARERWTEVAGAAHSLKSSARSIGARSLADRAEALEHWGGPGVPEDIAAGRGLLTDFEIQWCRVAQALEAKLKKG